MKRYSLPVLFFLATSFLCTNAVYAQNSDADKIALRVARLSIVDGPVTMLRTTDEDWVAALVNTPLLVEDKLYAGEGARVEVQMEDQVVLRISRDTYIDFLSLDDSLGQIDLQKGTLAVSAQEAGYNRPPLEILTPTVRAVVTTQTQLRFDVAEDGSTELQVRRGEAKILRSNNTYFIVKRGERLFAPSADPASFQTLNLRTEDTFDRWCDMRDAELAVYENKAAVTERIAGLSDLDRYGQWVDTSDYGRVWRPTVTTVNWTPYYDGEWAWRYPYGWTWVSYEPWGWAPYHYGRWVHLRRHNWCWVPWEVRHVTYRPYWRPALVSFTYARHGRYFNYSYGNSLYPDACMGWFPLGPRDPYVPWYSLDYTYVHRHSHRFYRPSHSTSVTNIVINNNYIYQNQHVVGAITVMPARDFHSGNFRTKAPITLDRSQASSIAIGHNALPNLSERRRIETKARKDSVQVAYSDFFPSHVREVPDRMANTRGGATNPALTEQGRLTGMSSSTRAAVRDPKATVTSARDAVRTSAARGESGRRADASGAAVSTPRGTATTPGQDSRPLQSSTATSASRGASVDAGQDRSADVSKARASAETMSSSRDGATSARTQPGRDVNVREATDRASNSRAAVGSDPGISASRPQDARQAAIERARERTDQIDTRPGSSRTDSSQPQVSPGRSTETRTGNSNSNVTVPRTQSSREEAIQNARERAANQSIRQAAPTQSGTSSSRSATPQGASPATPRTQDAREQAIQNAQQRAASPATRQAAPASGQGETSPSRSAAPQSSSPARSSSVAPQTQDSRAQAIQSARERAASQAIRQAAPPSSSTGSSSRSTAPQQTSPSRSSSMAPRTQDAREQAIQSAQARFSQRESTRTAYNAQPSTPRENSY
ncbi:MAG: FecR domain-containing protein, partial [bacterium]|nr:FecR domain-containing protein [bacterium]